MTIGFYDGPLAKSNPAWRWLESVSSQINARWHGQARHAMRGTPALEEHRNGRGSRFGLVHCGFHGTAIRLHPT